VAILTGQVDETDLPPDLVKVQHQHPAPIQTRATWFPSEGQERAERPGMHQKGRAT